MQLPVRAIAFSPDGKHAMSASEGERQIALWHLEGLSSKKSQPSCGLLSLEDPVVQIASSPSPSSAPADTFQVCRPGQSNGCSMRTVLSHLLCDQVLETPRACSPASLCTPPSHGRGQEENQDAEYCAGGCCEHCRQRIPLEVWLER